MKFLVYRLVIASAIARAEHIITVSHFTEKDILLEYPRARKKISVTYEAADPFCQFLLPEKERELFSRISLLRDDAADVVRVKPYCLYVGNAYPHKNLEAFLDITPQFPACAFVLVGKEDYFYVRLQEKVREQKVHNIIFAGFVDDGELSSLYRHALCYIFPSLYEGFGLPPLEAMARGVPVLASTLGSLPEILSEAAFYFDPHTVKSLQEKLAFVLENESLRQEKVSRGYARVNEFSFERMAQETLVLYSNSVKNKE